MSPDEFGLTSFEILLLNGFSLSLSKSSGFSGVIFTIDTLVLKEFCKRYKIDFLWVVGIYKEMIKEIEED